MRTRTTVNITEFGAIVHDGHALIVCTDGKRRVRCGSADKSLHGTSFNEITRLWFPKVREGIATRFDST